MANSKQARKRAIQAVARNKHLSAQRSRYRTAIKNVRKAILAGDKAAAQTLYVTAQSVIDSMADKGVLHKNAAARHKSYQGNGLINLFRLLRSEAEQRFQKLGKISRAFLLSVIAKYHREKPQESYHF